MNMRFTPQPAKFSRQKKTKPFFYPSDFTIIFSHNNNALRHEWKPLTQGIVYQCTNDTVLCFHSEAFKSMCTVSFMDFSYHKKGYLRERYWKTTLWDSLIYLWKPIKPENNPDLLHRPKIFGIYIHRDNLPSLQLLQRCKEKTLG